MAGVKIVRINYKGGGDALVDLLGGRIHLYFATALSGEPYIKSGKLRALAVTGPHRSPLLPEVPTAQEGGLKDFDVTIWFGVLAPAGTPSSVVDRLAREITNVMSTDEMKKRMQDDGAEARPSSPSEFSALIRSDMAKWAPIVKASGASLD